MSWGCVECLKKKTAMVLGEMSCKNAELPRHKQDVRK